MFNSWVVSLCRRRVWRPNHHFSCVPPGVACSVILMYIFCTDCWLIAVLYFTWLAFDWNTPKKGKLGLRLYTSSFSTTPRARCIAG